MEQFKKYTNKLDHITQNVTVIYSKNQIPQKGNRLRDVWPTINEMLKERNKHHKQGAKHQLGSSATTDFNIANTLSKHEKNYPTR